MDISRETREQLKAISLELFGASGRWRKILDTGVKETVTRKTTEIIPGEESREIEVPVLLNGKKQFKWRYFNPEELLEYLLSLKVKRDEFMAQIKKQQDEAKAKKEADDLAKQVQDDLGGSALGGKI